MLTGKLVRVRYARDRIVPCYVSVEDPVLLEMAGRLRELFLSQEGRTRGELDADLRETFGSDPTQLVVQGLAKLLADRCEFEVVSGHPPEQLRELVFGAAALQRQGDTATQGHGEQTEPESGAGAVSPRRRVAVSRFDRDAVLRGVAAERDLTPEAVDQGLFADLKSEQRLTRFKDLSALRLLQRYNVALAQAVLLRSTGVQVHIRGEQPPRYRQLLRLVKFHRLVCEVSATGSEACSFHLDGPLSLFAATQKYGLQLALFLPAILHCRDFDLRAELRWGPQRKPKHFTLSHRDGLVSHTPDSGMYVPPELAMFVELFRKKITDWDIQEETDLLPLGDTFWVPDFRLVQRATGRLVYLEVLGFWRRAIAEKHLERLRRHIAQPYLLAVSEQLRVDEAELEGLPAGIHKFRQMPLPDEIARLANELILRTNGHDANTLKA